MHHKSYSSSCVFSQIVILPRFCRLLLQNLCETSSTVHQMGGCDPFQRSAVYRFSEEHENIGDLCLVLPPETSIT